MEASHFDLTMQNGHTALHMACSRGHTAVVQLLLQNSADASIVNIVSAFDDNLLM